MGMVKGALTVLVVVVAIGGAIKIAEDDKEPDYLGQEKETVVQKVRNRGFDTLGIDSFTTDGDKHLESARLTVYIGEEHKTNPVFREPCMGTVVWKKGKPGFPEKFDLYDTSGSHASESAVLLPDATDARARSKIAWWVSC